jgi:hypothetical protein
LCNGCLIELATVAAELTKCKHEWRLVSLSYQHRAGGTRHAYHWCWKCGALQDSDQIDSWGTKGSIWTPGKFSEQFGQ